MRRLLLGLAALAVVAAGCSANSAQPTPIIIYVTPPPTRTPSVTPRPTVSQRPTPTPVAQLSPDDFQWVPDDFQNWFWLGPGRVLDSLGLAYRFLDETERDCDFDIPCSGIYVITRDGCPSSLYVEVNLLDDDGTVVGFTNDVAGGLRAGQQAKLTFSIYEAGVSRVSITQMSCY